MKGNLRNGCHVYCLTNTKCMFSATSGLTSVSELAVFETTFHVLVNMANGDR
jgi:hypothetical protein